MRRRAALGVLWVLLTLYVGTYAVLSRRGLEEARQFNMQGFYYFFPEDNEDWRVKHRTCCLLFYPVNVLDCWLGWGKAPGYEPMWGLSKE